jgi:hypothetical protein
LPTGIGERTGSLIALARQSSGKILFALRHQLIHPIPLKRQIRLRNADSSFSAYVDGSGWALFKPGDKDTNVASNYKTDCLGCHQPAKDKDWVYTEAYPTLSKD